MDNPENSIGFLVNDIARLMRRNFNRRVQELELDLSQAQWKALANLARQEGVNQVTLAETLEIQPITLARTIDRLQEAGLVTRRPDPDDRRAVRLYLTPKAQPLLDNMWQLAVQIRDEAMADLSNKNQEMLVKLLQQVKQRLLCADTKLSGAVPNLAEGTTNGTENA